MASMVGELSPKMLLLFQIFCAQRLVASMVGEQPRALVAFFSLGVLNA